MSETQRVSERALLLIYWVYGGIVVVNAVNEFNQYLARGAVVCALVS